MSVQSPASSAFHVDQSSRTYLVSKCARFLRTLLYLSQKQSFSTYDSVKQLVKDVIYENVTTEEFSTKLQSLIRSQAQDNLVPFLNSALPLVRQVLDNEDELASSSDVFALKNELFPGGLDWSAKKPELGDQIARFCMQEEMADIEFVFDRKNTITKIPAHSFVLSVASEVFQKEITYARERENEAIKLSKVLQTLEIKDERIDIDAFKTMLLFIYNAYKNVNLTGDSVLAVFYIGMKYMIKPLESYCVDYLVENLDAENIFTILQFCLDCEVDRRLMESCQFFLGTKTSDVIAAKSFPKISHKCLTFLLNQDFLDVAEIRLFKAALRWTKLACKISNDDPDDGKTLRSKLGPALNLIRFSTMSIKQIAEIVAPSGILKWKEERDLMYVIGGAKPIGTLISTVTEPRSPLNNKKLKMIDSSSIQFDANTDRCQACDRDLTYMGAYFNRAQHIVSHLPRNDQMRQTLLEKARELDHDERRRYRDRWY